MDFGLLRFFRHINRKVNQFQLEQFLRPGVDILCIALSPTYSWFLLFFAALRLPVPARQTGLCERGEFPCLAIQAGQIAKKTIILSLFGFLEEKRGVLSAEAKGV